MHRSYLVTLLIVLAFSPSISDAEICWIKDVKKTTDSIEISFEYSAMLMIWLDKRKLYFKDGIIKENAMPETDHLSIKAGDIVYLAQGVHDECTLEYQVKNGKAGIWAKSEFYEVFFEANEF